MAPLPTIVSKRHQVIRLLVHLAVLLPVIFHLCDHYPLTPISHDSFSALSGRTVTRLGTYVYRVVSASV